MATVYQQCRCKCGGITMKIKGATAPVDKYCGFITGHERRVSGLITPDAIQKARRAEVIKNSAMVQVEIGKYVMKKLGVLYLG